MDVQEEREAFEQHLTDTGLVEFAGYGFAVDECDEYLHEPTQVAWDSWLIGLNRTKAQAVPEWISVEDSLPKKNTKVLLNVVARRRGKPLVCVGFYSIEPDDDPCFVLDDNFTVLKGVTHWMMLPQPPKAQEQKG